jgi:glycosyltransferase involved in cell wall biosynthesis
VSRTPPPENATVRVVLYTDSPVIGGGENFARDLLAHLHPQFEPVVIGVRPEVVAHCVSGRPSMEWRVLPAVRGRTDLGSILEQAKVLRELEPDVVHINQHLWSGQYGALACALAGVPSVGVVHGAMPPASPGQRYLTMATARLPRRFVGVSHFVSSQIRSELHVDGRRLSTIYNGIPTEEPEASRLARTLPGTILGVGRLAREKGFDLLIEAMPALPGRRLLLAGDGPERGPLEDLADLLGVADRVEFAGWVSEPWASRFRPDVVAVPSRFDAMPLVVLEAMRAGIPVVATRVGGTSELVVDNVTGMLVEPENALSLAHAIESLLASPQRGEDMSGAAKERLVERFSDSKMIRSYEALYATISGQLPPPSSVEATFGPATGQRHARLLGLAQILPPETRGRAKDLVRAGGEAIRRRSLSTSSSVRSPASSPAPAFVLQHLDSVRGDVLVLGDARLGEVSRAFNDRIGRCTVWDLEPRNLEASLLVDPLRRGSFGTGEYDCELVVDTMWQGSDRHMVLTKLWQALRPGGTLLFATPAAHTDEDRFTETELRAVLKACCPTGQPTVVPMGADQADGQDRSRSDQRAAWLVAHVKRPREDQT